MWFLASLPNEMLTLGFEDFENRDRQKYVLYFAFKKSQREKFTFYKELSSMLK